MDIFREDTAWVKNVHERDQYKYSKTVHWGPKMNKLEKQANTLGKNEVPELAGTMFVLVLGRFFTGLSTMNYGRSLGGNTAGREIGQVAIACVQHIG